MPPSPVSASSGERPRAATCCFKEWRPRAEWATKVIVADNKAQVLWPAGYNYTVQLNAGDKQTTKKRPSYIVVIVTKNFHDTDSMDSLIHVSYKGKPRECTRLRCLDKDCPLRSDEERAKLNAVVDSAMGDLSKVPKDTEIEPDDREAADVDDNVEEEAADGDEEEGGVPVPPPNEPKVRCVQELWPFAMPKEWYKQIIHKVMGGGRPHCIVVMTTSAQPLDLCASGVIAPPPPVLGGFVPVPAFWSLIRAASCRRLPSGHSAVGRLRAGPTHGTEVVGGFPIVLKVA